MQQAAAKVLSEGFLKGFFDVFDAMLSLSFKFECGSAEPADPALISTFLANHPVHMRGQIQGGLGAVAVLLSKPVSLQIVDAIMGGGGADKNALDSDDVNTLQEVAEPALGSGITNLMEKFGKGIVQLEAIQVDPSGPTVASTLAAFVGSDALAVPFKFNGGAALSGDAVLLFSANLEGMVPASLVSASPSQGTISQPALSKDEMNDILSGFPDSPLSPRASAYANPDHQNLDMVLDIRLLATARLGRVEMPIGDILSLGPGSIIEVGHLVDEPIELLINDKLIARGDVVVVDEKFGLRITEIVSQKERIESLR